MVKKMKKTKGNGKDKPGAEQEKGKVQALFEEPAKGSEVPGAGEPEPGPTDPKSPAKDVESLGESGKSLGVKFIPLNRLHSVEVELVALKIVNSENRIQQAQKDLVQAQKDNREAKAASQAAADQILREMKLDAQSVINVDNKVVLPPQGQEFVRMRAEK